MLVSWSNTPSERTPPTEPVKIGPGKCIIIDFHCPAAALTSCAFSAVIGYEAVENIVVPDNKSPSSVGICNAFLGCVTMRKGVVLDDQKRDESKPFAAANETSPKVRPSNMSRRY